MKKLILIFSVWIVGACQVFNTTSYTNRYIDDSDMVVKFHNSTYYAFSSTYLNQAVIQQVGSACEYLQPHFHDAYGCAVSPAIYYYDVRKMSNPKVSLGDFICLRMEKELGKELCLISREGEATINLFDRSEMSEMMYKEVCLADHDTSCKQIDHPDKNIQ